MKRHIEGILTQFLPNPTKTLEPEPIVDFTTPKPKPGITSLNNGPPLGPYQTKPHMFSFNLKKSKLLMDQGFTPSQAQVISWVLFHSLTQKKKKYP